MWTAQSSATAKCQKDRLHIVKNDEKGMDKKSITSAYNVYGVHEIAVCLKD